MTVSSPARRPAPVRRLLSTLPLAVMLAAGAAILALAHPEPAFAFRVTQGRLSLYSDQPFTPERGRAFLADVQRRLRASPLDDGAHHSIFVTNTGWRRAIAFFAAPGAAGLNYHPLTANVFIRRADVDRDRVIGASGREAAPPRTLAYYAAHEIAHTLTSERRGPGKLWNRTLPQWVREGYADYVGMGVRGEADELFRRLRAGDPALDVKRSGQYARFRLLTAYYLEVRGWTVEHLLRAPPPQAEAEREMTRDLAAPS